jgi:hypothetical protein
VYTNAAGAPGAPVGDADCTGTFTSTTTLSNVYRVTTVGGDSARRLQRVEYAFGGDGCQLSAGTYWLVWSFEGSLSFSGPWQPPVPRPIGSTTCPTLIGGPAQQSIAGGSFAAVLNGTCNNDMTFSLLGNDTPPPAYSINVVQTSVTTSSPGSFQITYQACNNSGSSQTGDIFFTAGPYSGIIQSGTLANGQCTPNLNHTQQVPAGVPAGNYNYVVRMGQFPNTTVASDVVAVTVTAPRTGQSAEASAPLVWPSASAVTSGVSVSPNPFAGRTTVSFEVAAAGAARLSVYDVLGREVAVLVDGHVEAGSHSATFDGRGLASGTYVYRLVVGSEVQTGRITLAN